MANFLNTLRAWGESLFTSKKAWIGSQAFPAKIARIDLSLGSSVYTPASDGYIGVYTTAIADIYQSINGRIAVRMQLRINDGGNGVSSVIPVVKGEEVSIAGRDISELWFIPSAGSQ